MNGTRKNLGSNVTRTGGVPLTGGYHAEALFFAPPARIVVFMVRKIAILILQRKVIQTFNLFVNEQHKCILRNLVGRCCVVWRTSQVRERGSRCHLVQGWAGRRQALSAQGGGQAVRRPSNRARILQS